MQRYIKLRAVDDRDISHEALIELIERGKGEKTADVILALADELRHGRSGSSRREAARALSAIARFNPRDIGLVHDVIIEALGDPDDGHIAGKPGSYESPVVVEVVEIRKTATPPQRYSEKLTAMLEDESVSEMVRIDIGAIVGRMYSSGVLEDEEFAGQAVDVLLAMLREFEGMPEAVYAARAIGLFGQQAVSVLHDLLEIAQAQERYGEQERIAAIMAIKEMAPIPRRAVVILEDIAAGAPGQSEIKLRANQVLSELGAVDEDGRKMLLDEYARNPTIDLAVSLASDEQSTSRLHHRIAEELQAGGLRSLSALYWMESLDFFPHELEEGLLAAVHDRNIEVRIRSINAIARIGKCTVGIEEAFVGSLSDVFVVRRDALNVLSRIGCTSSSLKEQLQLFAEREHEQSLRRIAEDILAELRNAGE